MFYLRKDTKIYICGKNKRAELFRENLLRNGYRFVEIGDSRLSETRYMPGEYTGIIALSNALRHKEIATVLQEQGIENLIYVPIHEKDTYKACRQAYIYNILLYGDYEDGVIEFPQFDYKRNDGGTIANSNGIKMLWIDKNKLYCNNELPADKHAIGRDYYGKPINEVLHYKALFQYLQGQPYNSDYLNEYMVSQGYTDSSGEYDVARLNDREELYKTLLNHYENGISYFVCTASLVIMEEGKYYIKEGLHRAIFLEEQGEEYIPVLLKNSVD